MENFLKLVFEEKESSNYHRYFLRFGKGNYKRRFLIKFNKGKKIKIKASFELANDFVNFVNQITDAKFSGKIFMKEKIQGEEGKKKAGSFVYEVENSSLDKFENAYFYLLDVNSEDLILKIKKAIPKPGKSENKIDDKFCSLEMDLKFWDIFKREFFWDVPDCKKAEIEHEVIISDIIMPTNINDPVKIRELAKRKGKIIRKIVADGKEILKEINFEA